MNNLLGTYFQKIKHSNEYKTFENKLITKNLPRPNKLKEYKIFKLKYENNVWKY